MTAAKAAHERAAAAHEAAAILWDKAHEEYAGSKPENWARGDAMTEWAAEMTQMALKATAAAKEIWKARTPSFDPEGPSNEAAADHRKMVRAHMNISKKLR